MPGKKSTPRHRPKIEQVDPLFRPDEAAEYTGIPSGSLRNRRFRGLPPRFLKPTPKVVLYRKSDLDEWLNGSEQTITG